MSGVELAKFPPYIAFIGVFTIVILILCSIYGCWRRLMENEQAEDEIMEEEGLSPTSARRMVELARTRDWLLTSGYSLKSSANAAHLDIRELLKHEFYTMVRWVKRLEMLKSAPDPDAMCKEVDYIIEEIKDHATNFNLPDYLQEEILHLCRQLPERSLYKYDNYFLEV